MNRYLLLSLLFFVPSLRPIQKNITCCGTSSTEQFAKLANIPAFVRAHPNPPKLKQNNFEGSDIHYLGTDGKEAHAYEFKTKTKSNKYLLVVHDWLGLGDYAKTESQKFFHDLGDVNVIALDLYDNKVTTKPDSAAKLMQSVTSERAMAIIQGAINMLGKDAQIATVGWCFGGGWSLQTALAGGNQTIACVVYYGMPEKNVEKLKSLHSDVYGIFADKDKWINKEVVAQFQKDMKAAGKTLTVKHYDADHGFGNPSSPVHDEAAAKDAYANALQYLKTRLG